MLKPQLYVRAEQTWDDQYGNDQAVHVGVQWTPGAGLSGLSAVRAAGQRMSAAQQAEESARRQINEEVGSAYAQYQGTQERLGLQVKSLQTLIAIRDSYLRQFMAGRRQWQEVMNAVRDVSDARYSIADIRASLLISGYQGLLLAKGDAGIADVQPLAVGQGYE
jgi:adhesin transport system outer membrane protein